MVRRRIGSLSVSILGAIIVAAMLAPSASAQDMGEDVPFLTIRDRDGNGGYFGDARSTLSAGICTLETVDAGGLTPVLESGPTFIREQLLQIEEVATLSPNALIRDVPSTPNQPPALYVHGYYIDFDKGCRRAALLQRNADIAGRMVWFSWPSDGDVLNYARDEADLYWSVPDIADATIALNEHATSAGGANIIGHSLGGRGVVLALYEIANQAPETRLGHVVLLAPDMDFWIFARLLPRILPIAKSITVYVSDEDRPLALSEQLHGYPRLGQSGSNAAVLNGIEVIDVSRLPNESASGHLYHIHNAEVGQDLSQLLNADLMAGQREGLERTGVNAWSIVAK